MTNYLVLTIIGDDKPGLVESLSQIIAENSGNWLESSMSQLDGKFAGILRVSVANQAVDKLISELESLSGDLKIIVEKAGIADGRDHENIIINSIELSVVGNDRSGIVREISHALASLSVSVEKLSTQCIAAPMSGEILFKASAQLKVPSSLDLDELQSVLEEIADDLIVELLS
jgi:glycine cleavage system regulatory protein